MKDTPALRPTPHRLLALLLLSGAFGAASGGTAVAQDEGRSTPLPFSGDMRPPAPLPVPLDRHLRGEILAFDGDRIRLRWDWADAGQLDDFDRFVPVRSGLRGGFKWAAAGRLEAGGTGGIRLRLGMFDDLSVKVGAKLVVPHDLGVVLAKPDSSDESILCLVQDRFFTRFDAAAGNANMINKMGGIPATAPGVVEFRYVDRKPTPSLSRGDRVTFDVVRKGPRTRFVIGQEEGDPTVLAGDDTDTPMTRFTAGLYVASGAADFGPLEIEGRIDPDWCEWHDVLPHFASDLLHKGNRFKGAEKRAAALVERFLAQTEETPEKKRVSVPAVAALVGQTKLPLVIRIRAAESLTEKGMADGTVVDGIAKLLDAGDRAARLLAWQVLRPQLPWHFNYDPDGDAKDRREGALLVGHYFRERDDALVQGKVFVDGYWYTPSRADAVRGDWARAWDLRTPHVRVRTNLTKEWADWYLAAMEASYQELVAVVGQEPPPEALPLSVLAFRTEEDYAAFCKENGYESKAAWGRFVDLERNVAFVTFKRREAPFWALGQMAKLFMRTSTGRYWPAWFSEGRASWFGNPSYKTAKWDGRTLELGLQAAGPDASRLRIAAVANELWSTSDFLARDPRALDGEERRLWYVHAWALHYWLMQQAPEDIRGRFALWQKAMQDQELSPRDVEAEGRRRFLAIFSGRVKELDRLFKEWALTL